MTRKGTQRTQSEPKQAIKILCTAEEMQKITEAAAARGLTRTAYVKLRSLNQRTPMYISQTQRQIYENAVHLHEKIQEMLSLVAQLQSQAIDPNAQSDPNLKEEIHSQLDQALEITRSIQCQAIGFDGKKTTRVRRSKRAHHL